MTLKAIFGFASIFLVISIGSMSGCGKSSGLKGQTNTSMTFYGKAVDQNGRPLANAHFEYRLEAYPSNWTYDSRGRENDASTITAVSGEDGRFQFSLTGCKLIRLKATCAGYRELSDQDSNDDNWFYRLIAWSDLNFKMDVEHPAVYVFVAPGVHAASVMPCRGGFEDGGTPSQGPHRWNANKPSWPKRPTLPDVTYRAPTTSPNGKGN